MPDGMAICPACGRSAPPRSLLRGLRAFAPTAAGNAILPSALPRGTAPAPADSRSARNLPALLSYAVLPAIAYFFLEPYRRNAFLRFHAIQSLLFFIAAGGFIALAAALATVSALAGWLLLILVLDLCAVLLGVLALKAYHGKPFRLPLLGDLAAQQAGLE